MTHRKSRSLVLHRLSWCGPLVFAGVLVLVLSCVAITISGAGAAVTSAPDILTTCTEAALSPAIAETTVIDFGCSGTIAFSSPLSIGAGESASISGSGQTVTLSGGGKHQLFKVAGSLTLVDLTLSGGSVVGPNGGNGKNGSDGEAGTNGSAGADVPGAQAGNGTAGTNGSKGSVGAPGQSASKAQGGAVVVDPSGHLVAAGDTFTADSAVGGDAGDGGDGAAGRGRRWRPRRRQLLRRRESPFLHHWWRWNRR